MTAEHGTANTHRHLRLDLYLVKNHICLCVHDMLGGHPRQITGPAAYVRFHGASGDSGGGYSRDTLQNWADWLQEAAKVFDVFVYFNNDLHGYAVRDARTLKEMLGLSPAPNG